MKETYTTRLKPTIENIMSASLAASRSSDNKQDYGEMAALISQISQYYRELMDVENGARNTYLHRHHPADELRKTTLSAILQVMELQATIKGVPGFDFYSR